MATYPLRSILWFVLRIGGLIAVCLFLIARAPSTVERDRLEKHGVVLHLDETGQVVVGIDLTDDVLSDEVINDISALNSIRSVRLTQVSGSDELFRAITGLPNLRSVSCQGCTISDEQLAMLQNVQLQVIDLSDTTGLHDGLLALGPQESLTRVVLRGCQWFTDDDLRLMPSFTLLRDLDISNTSITDDGLAPLAFSVKLSYVDLTGCGQLTGASLHRLKLCKGLKTVVIRDVPVSLSAAVEFQAARPDVNLSYDQILAPDLLRLIRPGSNTVKTTESFEDSRFPRAHGVIHTLNVDLHSASDISVLSHLPQLTALRMTGRGVDDSALPYIAGMKSLRTLDLSGSHLSESAFSEMPVFEALARVSLADTQVSVSTLRWLASLPNLSILDLSGSTITGSAVEARLAFSELSLLDLNRAHFTKDILARLDVPVLVSLQLRSCDLNDVDLNSLAAYPNLKVLDLAENPLAGHWLAACRNLPLTELCLHRTGLTDAGLESVSCLKSLTHLDVSDTTISGTGFKTCSDLSLYFINLDGVTLSSEGIDAICQLKSLRSLNLQNAVLPEDSFQSLSNKLQLTGVSLDGKSENIQAFAQPDAVAQLESIGLNRPDKNALRLLRQFPEVRSVTLLHCDVDTEAAELIILAPKCTFTQLNECTITNEAMRVLASSETLRIIQLRGMDSTDLDIESLRLINGKISIHHIPSDEY